MYKAQHQPSGQEIIILDPRWRAQVNYLRKLDKKDALVCPGCLQPVRVRAGKTRRWHFAHKHLQNCPFDRETPALLSARAVLYQRLVDQFDPEFVTLEKILDTFDLPRHVDCWVENDQCLFAYWIFDRRLPPEKRTQLQVGFGGADIQINWVFVSDLLRVDWDLMQARLHLTTTERAFIQQSEFDQAWQTHFEQLGGSLHYLDTKQETLTTYRNLHIIHKPQLYAGTCLTHPLADVRLSPHTGEFIHPGEVEQASKRQREIQQQEEKAQQRLQRAREFFGEKPLVQAQSFTVTQLPQEHPFEKVGTCRVCGQETADWITYFGQTRECVCRHCKNQA